MELGKRDKQLPHYHLAYLVALIQIICYLLSLLFWKRHNHIEFVQTVLTTIFFIIGGVLISTGIIELLI
jgi:hypothetical protein